MADVLPVQPDREGAHQVDAPSTDGYSSAPRKVAAPTPNPEFSFPMMPIHATAQKLDDLLPSPVSAGSRRRPANISVEDPPSPWGLLPPSPTKFTPTSDSAHSSPTRGGAAGRTAHKRAGSEFIGGDGSNAGPGLMSTSPTKGDGALASIPASGRRRGHAHRRSGAISHHDLSAILKPSAHDPLPIRPGSLPTTPTVPDAPPLIHAASQPSLHHAPSETTPPATPSTDADKPSNNSPPTTRPRVGFSDTVEFIPRPLSTISSETSSSMSTIRASHSVTGSISSIVSNSTPSPSSARKSQYTADILQRYRQGDTAPYGGESPTPLLTAKRGSPPPQRLRDVGEDAPTEQRPNLQRRSSSPDKRGPGPPALSRAFESSKAPEAASPLPSPPHSAGSVIREFSRSDLATPPERPRSSPEAKIAKKQKKSKGWAGSILSRRAKGKLPEGFASDSSAAISRQDFATLDDFSLDDVNFDDDNTCVIKSPDYEPPSSANSTTSTPPIAYDEYEPDHSSAVLDLDATWQQLDEEDQESGFSAAKKRMHSAGAMGGFAGPGMHYHRRAESAPALTPMNNPAGLRHLGSNSQMADVFEEEEEDDAAKEIRAARTTSADAPAVAKTPAVTISSPHTDDDSTPRPSPPNHPHENLPAIITDHLESVSPYSEVQTPRDVPEFSDSVEIVDTVDEPRFSVITKSSDESTITPTLHTPNPFSEVATTPTPTTLHATATPPASSPDASHLTFDSPALTTAASSITDRSVWSASHANAAASMTYSTEDVPSLTSSASTTFSSYPAQASPIAAERPLGERSYSFSGITRRTPRPMSAVKRSSLASLSRLVGSSHGDRSKLSLGTFAPVDAEETAEKKKRNRISRLMKFWKPKAKAEAGS